MTNRPTKPRPGRPPDTRPQDTRAPAASPPTSSPQADLRGGARLAVDGTRHITGLVEALHGQIQRVALPLRRRPAAAPPQATTANDSDGLPRSRGLTRLVYRSIQGTTRLVGAGLDGLLAPFDAALAGTGPAPRRDALVAALNGVLGDHLQRSSNPLAIPMQLRQGGAPLHAAALGAAAPRRVLLLVHGLCMSDLGWCRNGHDHGQRLASALGAVPVYAWYNSGQHIDVNGLALAGVLQRLVQDWPAPLDELMIIGHSMGGLVARSAIHQADAAGHTWPQRLKKLVFLGTPHHGAPLERAGNWLHQLMDWSPYAAPFTRLTGLRSAGITDLRHGNLLAADWQGASRFDHRDRRTPVPLPKGVACYAMAGTAGSVGNAASGANLASVGALLAAGQVGASLVGAGLEGDGLVLIDSALGRHKRSALDLALAKSHTWVAPGVHHLQLLSDAAVYRRLLRWLGP